jgi:hypothetical protein
LYEYYINVQTDNTPPPSEREEEKKVRYSAELSQSAYATVKNPTPQNLWNPVPDYRVHNNLTHYFFQIYFNIVFPYTHTSTRWWSPPFRILN